MITVFARLRVEDWELFKEEHDRPGRIERRRRQGNFFHRVMNQIDDNTDVAIFDTWSSPQDSDDYYHSDEIQRDLESMGAVLVEIIKLEGTGAASISDGPSPFG